MGERPRVRVHLDEKGGVAGLDIEGQIDPEDVVEETPGKPTDPPRDDIYRPPSIWGAG